MQKEVSLLRESITIDTPLEQIVRKFKEIIDSQLDNPVYIFESVWFPFADNGLFYFSLVAIKHENDPIQHIRLDLRYEGSLQMCKYNNLMWSDTTYDFWNKILNTDIFRTLVYEKRKPIELTIQEIEL